MQGCVHEQEKLGSKHSHLTDLGAQCKVNVKAQVELEMPAKALKMCSKHAQFLGTDWETYWFQAFRKTLSNHQLTSILRKKRMQWKYIKKSTKFT